MARFVKYEYISILMIRNSLTTVGTIGNFSLQTSKFLGFSNGCRLQPWLKFNSYLYLVFCKYFIFKHNDSFVLNMGNFSHCCCVCNYSKLLQWQHCTVYAAKSGLEGNHINGFASALKVIVHSLVLWVKSKKKNKAKSYDQSILFMITMQKSSPHQFLPWLARPSYFLVAVMM